MGRPQQIDPEHFSGGRNLTPTASEDKSLSQLYNELVEAGEPETITRLYVDTVNGDDDNDGTSWAKAKQTEAIFDEVPVFGWAFVYVRGSLTITRQALPYNIYYGQLRIIGADDWSQVASGTVTSYTGSAGRFESDHYDLNLGGYVKADATDRRLFLEVQDDAGMWHIIKVLEYDFGGGGLYDVERPGGLTVSPGNACKLVTPVTEITINDRITATYHLLGSVWMFGVNITAPNKIYPSRHIGYAACMLDFTAATYAFFIERASGFGILTAESGTHGADYFATMPEEALVGTYTEGKHGPTTRYPGCWVGLKASGQIEFAGNRRNQWMVYYTVFEGGVLDFGYGLIYANLQDCRGVDTDLVVFTGSTIYVQGINFEDGVLRVQSGGNFWHWGGMVFGSIELDDGSIFGWGLSNITLGRSAPHDSIGVDIRPGGYMFDTKILGGYDLATPGTPQPLVKVTGKTRDIELQLTASNRGAGALVLGDDDGIINLGATASGDNSNAGGHGLEVRNGAKANLPATHALTGNSGGELRAFIGSLGLAAYPASGLRKNDLPANPAGTEELTVVAVR